MLRRLPVLATVVVLIAVAIMIRLGFWQLARLHEKEAMLARHAAAQAMSSEVPWPRSPADVEPALYRHATIECVRVIETSSTSGRSSRGEAGWAHRARCGLADGAEADVVLGWSNSPGVPAWHGGPVSGFIAPGGEQGPRLVAAPAQAGLGENAIPDPREIPNNHLSYAVQWFLFALTALVIYALALRKRLARADPAR